jgi:methylenetetrahydrofolate reductase (NADPH)
MRVIDIIQSGREPAFSFELIPPPRGQSIRDVIEMVQSLLPVQPKWFDVTSHSSSATFQEYPDGTVRRRIFKKRPGTIGICGVIQNRFKIDTVAHVLCLGFTREETEDALIELSYLGVENILALRGDNPNFEKRHAKDKSINAYAADLVKQVVDLRQGRFLDELAGPESLDFCVGVAGYPEKHFEAANLEVDVKYLAEKVAAGADYVITQMFFDNAHFHAFVKKCRAAGIQVPIIPGLKVLKSIHQLKSIPRTFHVDLPSVLVDEVLASPEHVQEIGVRWARKQVEDLLNHGQKNVHFYVMNDADLVTKAVQGLA